MNNDDQLATTLKQFSAKYSRRVWYARTALGNTVEAVRQEEERTPPKFKGSAQWLVASRYRPVADWRIWSLDWREWSHTLEH